MAENDECPKSIVNAETAQLWAASVTPECRFDKVLCDTFETKQDMTRWSIEEIELMLESLHQNKAF